MAYFPSTARDRWAVVAGTFAPFAAALAMAPFREASSDANVVLVLVLLVVAVAANGHRPAGVVAALSAGAWFDFFFTEPYNTFVISDRDDVETALLLLLVGVGATELALWGRRQQAASLRKAGYLAGIQTAADLGATGTSTSALVHHVEAQITAALHLRDCTFEYGVAGLGRPARLGRDGRVVSGGRAWDVDRDGLPTDTAIEVLVEGGGRVVGRFVMHATPAVPVPLEQRRLAVALADQVAAALR